MDNTLSVIKVSGLKVDTSDNAVLDALVNCSICLSATFFRRTRTSESTDAFFICAKSQVLGVTSPSLVVDGQVVSVEIVNEEIPLELPKCEAPLNEFADLLSTGAFSDLTFLQNSAATITPGAKAYPDTDTPRSLFGFECPRTPLFPQSCLWEDERKTPLTDGVFSFSGVSRRPRIDRNSKPVIRDLRDEPKLEDIQRTPVPLTEEPVSPFSPLPVGLAPAAMMQGYLSESLCLPCNSLSHSMPKCPHGVFVCPNCLHPDHNGNKCPERCRFCGLRHEGVSIMRCIKETAGKIRRHESLDFTIAQYPLFVRQTVSQLVGCDAVRRE